MESVSGNFALVILTASALGRCARHVLHQRETDETFPWDSESEFASLKSFLLLVEHHLHAESSPVDEMVERYRRPDGTLDHHEVGHIIFAHTIFHLCHCLLHHPFLLLLRLQSLKCRMPLNFWARSLQTSRDHACKLAGLLDNATAADCHVQSSFYAYSATVAGNILSLGIHAEQDAGNAPSSDLLSGSQQTLSTLERMGQVWAHASKMVRTDCPLNCV